MREYIVSIQLLSFYFGCIMFGRITGRMIAEKLGLTPRGK